MLRYDKLSIVIPAYNEEKRIRDTLECYSSFFNNTEIFITIAGTDKTLDIVKEFSENNINHNGNNENNINHNGNSIRYYHSEKRLGKGMGLLNSFNLVTGDIIVITDADMSIPPSEVHRLVKQLEDCDCVIGSRWLPESKILIKQPLKRRIASRGFNLLVRMMFGISFKDTQCGTKVFRRYAIRNIIKDMSTFNFAFDVDLLLQLKRKGYKIKEVPVTWNHNDGSSVELSKDIVTMFASIVRLKIVDSNFKFLVKNSFIRYIYKYMEGKK